MSFVVRHAGQGAAYDFDGARFVMKASGAETGGQLAASSQIIAGLTTAHLCLTRTQPFRSPSAPLCEG